MGPANAFVPHGDVRIEGAAGGPLSGLTFAAKDLYDVAGVPTGAGNPRWLETHPVPTAHSPAVRMLLEAGATLIGKTITDELAYSMIGNNIHYGTPENTLAPGRVPGGSSSGSAAAVAARACDFALGSDTGGSVRVPASNCGLYGLRTTHGVISLDGVAPLMPSYDTVGWFARDATTLRRVGSVMLPPSNTQWTQAVILRDAVAEAMPPVRAPLLRVAAAVQEIVGAPREVDVSDGGLEPWRIAYVEASAPEGWRVHGRWIDEAKPVFAPPIAARFEYARRCTAQTEARGLAARRAFAQRVHALLGTGTVAILPSAADVAPLVGTPEDGLESFRARTLRITSIAGHAGVPQVGIPMRTADGLPIGVSLMGPAGSDLALLALAQNVAQRLRD